MVNSSSGRSEDVLPEFQKFPGAKQLVPGLGLKPAHPQAAQSTDPEPAWIDETRRLLRLKHYSFSTERTYLQWIRRFLDYGRQTREGETGHAWKVEDFRNFISHLALKEKVASSTQNQAFNAVLFFYRSVLCKDVEDLGNAIRAKRGQRLPTVLSVEEVKKLLAKMSGRPRLMAELLYGSGLRLMELAALRVKDIDFDANTIFVRSGKGDKDRATVLPLAVKERLREHLTAVRELHDRDVAAGRGVVALPDALARKYPSAGKQWAWQYVFPSPTLSIDPRSGKVGRRHVSDTTIQTAFRTALQSAGIAKHATVHTLRHSFATHLLMSGVNIREVQELLGHKNVETTLIYTHVLRDTAGKLKSPLDALFRPRRTGDRGKGGPS